MSEKFQVLLSTTYGEWVKVEADNKDEALEKAEAGDWEEIADSKMVDREVTGDVRCWVDIETGARGLLEGGWKHFP
jgi:hypothetical protein